MIIFTDGSLGSVSFTAAMLMGYDSIANGASQAMPSFLLYFGEIGPTGPYLPSIWTSLWSSLSLAAQAVGAIVIGFVTDRLGRKWPACASSALTIVGTAVQYTSHARGVLLAGKILNGFGIGAAMAIATTYASEIAPLKLRGPVQQTLVLFYVFMLGLGLGIVRVFVPNIKEQAFRNVFAIQWIVAGIAVVAFAVAPESPNYLISKGRLNQAHKAMSTIYGSNNSINARLAFLVKVIREEQANRELHVGTYPECFQAANLKRTLTVVFIYTAVQWGGAALLAQSIYFLIIAGLPAIHAFDVSIGGFGLSIIIIISSWIFGDKLPRRKVFILGCLINFFFMLVIGALYYGKGIGPLWGIAILM
jgi:MFS family permease